MEKINKQTHWGAAGKTGSGCDDEALELEDIRRTSHLNIDTNHKNSAGKKEQKQNRTHC